MPNIFSPCAVISGSICGEPVPLLDAACSEAVLRAFARGRAGTSALLHSCRFLKARLAMGPRYLADACYFVVGDVLVVHSIWACKQW